MLFRPFLPLLIALLILPRVIKADIYTPVATQIETQDLNSILNRLFQKGLNLEGSLTELPKIKGLSGNFEKLEYKAKFKPKFEFESLDKINISTEIDEAYFWSKNLHLKYKIVKRVGSSKININTEIICDEIKVSLYEPIEYAVESRLYKNKVTAYKSSLPNNLDFKIESKNCLGPKGFEDFFPDLILEWIVSKEGVQQSLDFLNKEVLETYWNKIKSGYEIEFLGRKIFFSLLEIKENLRKFDLSLMLRWPDKDSFYLNMKDSKEGENFSISSQDLNIIVKDWINKGCFKFNYKRKDIAGVEKLFGSRLIQAFVWPDLMNFNRNVDFNFNISLCTQDLKFVQSNNQLVFQHSSSVFVEMNFKGPNSVNLPYMFFWSKASGQFVLSSGNQGLQLNLKNTKVDFKHQFHPNMMTWRKSKPSKNISLNLLVSYVLPEIEKLNVTILEDFEEVFGKKRVMYDPGSYLIFR
jgi:hypothetical protein